MTIKILTYRLCHTCIVCGQIMQYNPSIKRTMARIVCHSCQGKINTFGKKRYLEYIRRNKQ